MKVFLEFAASCQNENAAERFALPLGTHFVLQATEVLKWDPEDIKMKPKLLLATF